MKKNRNRAVLTYVLMGLYILVLIAFYLAAYWIADAGTSQAAQMVTYSQAGDLRYNIVPFRNLWGLVRNMGVDPGLVLALVPGQLAVLIPLGIFLPMLRKGLRAYSKLCLYMLLIFVILSALPAIFRMGWMDIDFMILVFAGVSIGYWIWRRFVPKDVTA